MDKGMAVWETKVNSKQMQNKDKCRTYFLREIKLGSGGNCLANFLYDSAI